jgi:copper transporter 1
MLLNWDTIDACFLFPTLQIKSSFEFFAACVGAFLLVISLEFLRRGQRQFDRYLQSKNRFLGSKRYIIAEEIEEKLLDKENEENIPKRDMKPRITKRVVLEQLVRGLIQMAQFSISYVGVGDKLPHSNQLMKTFLSQEKNISQFSKDS